ncbi:MAG: hypothetical protein PHH58_07640 [Rhodoferax sp.]|nr:hypothetical protein [Rhodoferax sp.]
MKTTLDLPDELVRQMKLRAVTQGRTLRDLVADFLRQGLGLANPKPAPPISPESGVFINTDGLPVFRCANSAPAGHMSIDQLLQLEQDALTSEDIQRAGLSV